MRYFALRNRLRGILDLRDIDNSQPEPAAEHLDGATQGLDRFNAGLRSQLYGEGRHCVSREILLRQNWKTVN